MIVLEQLSSWAFMFVRRGAGKIGEEFVVVTCMSGDGLCQTVLHCIEVSVL